MVVIVIIGILAAVAIPKLFGMSAKAKAQEVGPAVGTWVKLQQAYKMETGYWGGDKQISYKVPGGGKTDGQGATSNFSYEVDTDAEKKEEAKFSAKSKFSSDPCKEDSEWQAAFPEKGTETPELNIVQAGNSETGGCKSLTPNFYKIGCAKSGAPGADTDETCQ
jgi:type II secretory pathway pseudopilin PulG